MSDSEPTTTPKMANDHGILLSIMFGVIAFTVSVCVLYDNINPKDGTLQVYLSDQTDYIEGRNGEKDILFLGLEENFRAYLDSLATKDSITLLDTAIHNPDSIDKQYYTAQSRLLFNRTYFSKDSSYLVETLDQLDSHYEVKLVNFTSEKRYFFNQHPKILLWVLLISMAIAFSFCLIPLFMADIFRHNEGLPKLSIGLNIAASIAVIVCLFVPLSVSNDQQSLLIKPLDIEPLFDVGVKSFGLYFNSVLPFAGVLFWLFLIFSINSKVSQLYQSTAEESLKTYKQLQKEFERNFVIISALLAFTIFCTDTFLNALNALVNVKDTYRLFPPDFSYINGLMQTFFLILIYFTIIANFNSIKESIMVGKSEVAIAQNNMNKEKSFLEYLKVFLVMAAPALSGSIEKIIALFTG